MIAFAEEYTPTPILAAVRSAEPLGEVVRHRMPSSQWRRYDKMRRFPDGLLAVGDAICSFNPIYGQGMTVSALDAVALRGCLRRGGHDLPRRYFRAAAKHISVPWQMGAGSDLAFPEVKGRRRLSMRVSSRFGEWALTACEHDPITFERFFKVSNLVDPPIRLLHPSFLLRVATVNLRRRQGPSAIRDGE
jgi:2-polyprenyl-6-methoxyphenol hydroxylase-like FAD-dependent oxidoreductase